MFLVSFCRLYQLFPCRLDICSQRLQLICPNFWLTWWCLPSINIATVVMFVQISMTDFFPIVWGLSHAALPAMISCLYLKVGQVYDRFVVSTRTCASCAYTLPPWVRLHMCLILANINTVVLFVSCLEDHFYDSLNVSGTSLQPIVFLAFFASQNEFGPNSWLFESASS